MAFYKFCYYYKYDYFLYNYDNVFVRCVITITPKYKLYCKHLKKFPGAGWGNNGVGAAGRLNCTARINPTTHVQSNALAALTRVVSNRFCGTWVPVHCKY